MGYGIALDYIKQVVSSCAQPAGAEVEDVATSCAQAGIETEIVVRIRVARVLNVCTCFGGGLHYSHCRHDDRSRRDVHPGRVGQQELDRNGAAALDRPGL